ncbi:hypothetical protein BGZ67_005310 [Mortierella alpina]|nr:hypothetical protein BGZ67_005310 [Mortierella alpina]
MTASPFRSLFKTSSSSPDHDAARTQPKLRLSKPRQATAPSAAQNIDATAKKRSALFNLILPPDPTTSHAQSSMLLPPAALFPSLAGSGAKSPRLRDAFVKPHKKQPAPDKKCVSAGTSVATEPVRPWGAWIPGAAASSTALPMDDPDAPGQAKPSQARLWARRSEEKEVAKEEKRKAKLLKSAAAAAATSGQNGTDPYSADKQIMLHPSYNLSSQSVAAPSHPSSPRRHECLYACPQQQQQQQQEQLQHGRSRVFGVTLAVHDIFGIGKVIEMSLALFLAHDAFLSRRPFWLQCAVLAWEGLVVLLVLWGVLRVVGLAEVVVWGADDLIRGVVSIFRTLSLALKMFIFSL